MGCEGEGAPTRENVQSHLQTYRRLKLLPPTPTVAAERERFIWTPELDARFEVRGSPPGLLSPPSRLSPALLKRVVEFAAPQLVS